MSAGLLTMELNLKDYFHLLKFNIEHIKDQFSSRVHATLVISGVHLFFPKQSLILGF